MQLYEFLALFVAFCWASSGLITVAPAQHLGTFGFSRWRMISAATILFLITTVMQRWDGFTSDHLAYFLLSGFVGIFIGDTLLFACLNIMGPRRAMILFASNALFTVLLAYLFLSETISWLSLIGATILIFGVMLAIFHGKRTGNTHPWEQDRQKLSLGIILGLTAALCQAIGSILAKPAMDDGADPMAASAIRLSAAACLHIGLFLLLPKKTASLNPMTASIAARLVFSSTVGMGIGMTVLLLAMQMGDVGIVATLSATSPVLVLPMLWFFYKQSPPLGAWLGAGFCVGGTALILLS